MQIKITVRYHFIPTGMAVTKKTIVSVGEDVEKLESSPTGGDVEWGSALENSLVVPQKIKHRVTMGPSHSTPRCIPKGSETYIHTKIYVQRFIAALLTVKWWKQIKCPSRDEWINRMWSIHPVDC